MDLPYRTVHFAINELRTKGAELVRHHQIEIMGNKFRCRLCNVDGELVELLQVSSGHVHQKKHMAAFKQAFPRGPPEVDAEEKEAWGKAIDGAILNPQQDAKTQDAVKKALSPGGSPSVSRNVQAGALPASRPGALPASSSVVPPKAQQQQPAIPGVKA